MSAEITAGRPPDPEAGRLRRGDTPVGKTSNRPNDQPDPRHDSGEIALAAGGTLTSHRVAALPVLAWEVVAEELFEAEPAEDMIEDRQGGDATGVQGAPVGMGGLASPPRPG